MDIILSILAVLVGFSCLAAVLFSDYKDRRMRLAAGPKSRARNGNAEWPQAK